MGTAWLDIGRRIKTLQLLHHSKMASATITFDKCTIYFVIIFAVVPTSSASYPNHLVASDFPSHVIFIVVIVYLFLILNIPRTPSPRIIPHIIHPIPLILCYSPPSLVVTILKEEQVEWILRN